MLLSQFPNNITWHIDMKGFYDGDVPIGKTHKGLEGVAKEFFIRRIKEVTFSKGLTPSELKDFLNILIIGADELKKLGGAEKVLYDKGVKDIWVNEIPYDEMAKKLKELTEEKNESLDIEVEQEKKQEKGVQIEEEAQAAPEPPEKTPEEEQKNLSELLSLLDKENNTQEYKTIASDILEKVKQLKHVPESSNQGAEGRHVPEGLNRGLDESLPAVMTFANHAYFQPGRDAEQKSFAAGSIIEIASPDMIDYLVSRLCTKEETKKTAVQQILVRIGKDAVPSLINKLIEIEEAFTRKTLFNTLVMLNENARLEAEALLNDTRWFVVRQMVALIGAIGNPESVEKLKTIVNHKDIRIKKEVLKALARIPSKMSVEILIETLKARQQDVQLQAIASLGILKEPSSLPVLMELALKKEAFGGNMDMRKEAVKAVTAIGDKRAVPGLINILMSKTFFGKDRNEDLRCLAAIGIAKIGGEEAIKAIEDASKTAKGKLKQTCGQILPKYSER
ncbi:MAG: HEAT repeat domain-containing protein [Deltaproteobacteria bacterium]|nr:HEAT repeat domain-containing protein [Deltaproteobacteria bacterium]